MNDKKNYTLADFFNLYDEAFDGIDYPGKVRALTNITEAYSNVLLNRSLKTSELKDEE